MHHLKFPHCSSSAIPSISDKFIINLNISIYYNYLLLEPRFSMVATIKNTYFWSCALWYKLVIHLCSVSMLLTLALAYDAR